MNKVLVVAVHPDDETLGCGGTLLRHKSEGDKIYWLIATQAKKTKSNKRESAEIKKVSHEYGFEGVYKLGFPTMGTDEFPISIIIKKISDIYNKVKPNIIYLPFYSDIHSDHRIIFEAAYSCTKTFRYPFIKKVFMMETISETDFGLNFRENAFAPNHFVDITNFLNKKIEIMKIFKNEIGEHPFPRSPKNIESLAVVRGATAGCKYAEAFMLLKEVL